MKTDPIAERARLIAALRFGIKPLDDIPPSIQSQANIRLINAVNDAIAALTTESRPEGLERVIHETITHNCIRAEEKRNVGESNRDELLIIGVLTRILEGAQS